MSRKKPVPKESFVMFNVTYEDGTVTSHRRVPASILGGLDGDTPALTIIEEQDRVIAQHSGRNRGTIKTIVRALEK